MTKLIKCLDAVSFLKLIGIYCLVSVIVVVLGVLIFFPLMLVYSMLGWEFSNLGPIATFVCGILFEIFVVTPIFVILFVTKIIRKCAK